MKLKSFLEKTFLGETLVEKINSPINGEIDVYDGWFGKSMRIGEVTQSGELVKKLWKIGINEILRYEDMKILSALTLGLGCGNAAKLISRRWPEAQITGIEIDPVVIDGGKKYFGLGNISNLNIIVTDAIKEVFHPKFIIHNTKFNLILVDLYLGKEYPKEAEREEFLNGVKKLLSDGGVAIFNRLSYGEYEKPANEFAQKLRHYFPKVRTKKAITNLLIFCQK